MQPEQLTDRWQSEQAVLAVAAAAAGWQIRVMEPPTGVELDNLQLLYAARSSRWLTAGQDQLLAQQFTSPRTIRSGLRAAALPPYAGVDLAYHLIWAQRLHTDMGVRSPRRRRHGLAQGRPCDLGFAAHRRRGGARRC
ncbi:hypothetical protein [Streptomyces sp. NPDC056061]|uniref:hypothetical protein n=1 Tax=Streptomyces sp. NPDC056061 TaxID=3345700 RepID=UPI0035DDE50C